MRHTIIPTPFLSLFQLIRIQHRRGASDGREFLRFLEESLTANEALALKNASGEELEEGEVDDEEGADSSQSQPASTSIASSGDDAAEASSQISTPSTSKKGIIAFINSLVGYSPQSSSSSGGSGKSAAVGAMHRLIVADVSPKASSPVGIILDYLNTCAEKDAGAELAAKLTAENALWPVFLFAGELLGGCW